MGTAIHQVLIKIICSCKFYFLNMSKHYMTRSQPTALECPVTPSPSLSIPILGRGPQFAECIAAFSNNFPRLVALTFVVWTLQSSLKNQPGHCTFWGCPRPQNQSWALNAPSPQSRHSSFPLCHPLGWEEHGCLKLSPTCFN